MLSGRIDRTRPSTPVPAPVYDPGHTPLDPLPPADAVVGPLVEYETGVFPPVPIVSSTARDGLSGTDAADQLTDVYYEGPRRTITGKLTSGLRALAAQDVTTSTQLRPEEGASVPEGFASRVLATVAARGSAYGSPGDNHQTTADMLSSWLSRRLGLTIKLSAEDVCAINVIQKISRVAFCSKDDSWLDIAGYTENVALLPASKRNRQ